MYEYHDQYKRAHERGDTEAQDRWSNQLRWEIARHAVGEEIVVYPLMEKKLGERGLELAEHDRQEHVVRPQNVITLDVSLSYTEIREIENQTAALLP